MQSVSETLQSVPQHESKMPQIDIATFPMQLFWLVVIFALFYVVMAFLVLPRFRRKLERRQDSINEDIIAAKRFESQAEAARQFCEKHLAETRNTSRERFRQAQEKASHLVSSRESEVEIELHKQADEAADKLRQVQTKALSELPKEITALVSLTVKNFTGEEPDAAMVSQIVLSKLAGSFGSIRR